MSDAGPIVGIDLGTTYSLVAHVGPDGPRILPDPATGARLLPSVVHVPDTGPLEAGWGPRRGRVGAVGRTVTSVKRFMGKTADDVAREAPDLPYAVVPERQGAARFRFGARELTAPELSAAVLRELARFATAHLRTPVRRAVVTVPAYFNDAQRQATRDAGRLAGLEVVRILNEPTAASLAYGLDRLGTGTVAVFDLGGGTFDVSLLRVRQGCFEVLATNGDTHLGGDDVDAAVADWLAHAAGLTPAEAADPTWREAALTAAETAKCALSTEAHVAIALGLPGRPPRATVPLTRATLERLAEPIVARTRRPCRQALADAGLSARDLDTVVLVGGQTRMPLVQRTVAELFGRAARCDVDPDEVVALGAAVQAGIIEGRVPGVLLLDVIPLTLGIEALGGLMSKILPRNTPIPASVTERYTTAVDGQTSVDLHVLQGERELAADNRSLARFALRPIESLPAGLPRIDVTFTVDENGLLRVSATDARTLARQEVEVVPTSGLSETEIERLVAASYDHAEADVNAAILASARVEGDQLARRVEAALAEGDFAEGPERAAILAAVAALRRAHAGDARMAILDAMHAVEVAAQAAMQRRADRAIGAALRDRQVRELLGESRD